MLSRSQKAMVRKIAMLQEESFMRIVEEEKLKVLLQEMIEEGYNVDLLDLEEHAAKSLELWDRVKDDPDKFLNILDDLNLEMVRHHLVNEFRSSNPNTKTLHRKLTLFEEIKQNQN